MSPRQSATLSIEHVLLALLDKKPMHGYELYQELCNFRGISMVWNIKQALLYAILDKLETKGFLRSQLVQGETYHPRKYFHLTPAGSESLQHWLDSPVRRAREFRQEFLAKLIITRRYGKERALLLLERQQQACQSWLTELQEHLPLPNALDEWVVYSFRLNRVRGLLSWLEVCRTQIRSQEEDSRENPA